VVVGWFSYDRLGLDLLPKIDRPQVTITTKLAGQPPERSRRQITKVSRKSSYHHHTAWKSYGRAAP